MMILLFLKENILHGLMPYLRYQIINAFKSSLVRQFSHTLIKFPKSPALSVETSIMQKFKYTDMA
jgi:hypothetical protein